MKPGTLEISVGLIAAAALSAALFVKSAPNHHLVEVAKATWRRTTGDNGQACFDLWASSLKDPQMAQLLSTKGWGDDMIIVEYRARTDHGAYSKGYFDCLLINGKVDNFAVVMQRGDEAL
jgi:hypothetical protein